MKKIVGFSILAFLLLGAGYGMLRPKTTQSEGTVLKTVNVEKGSIQLAIACTGRVVSNLDVEIKCKSSGEIVELPYDISDPVKKGDLLMEIDPIDEKRNVRLAEITLLSSEAKLRQAELNLEYEQKSIETDRQTLEATLKSNEVKAKDETAKAKRMAELLAKKLASQEECDTAVTSEVQAKTTLETTRVQLKELDIRKLQVDVKRQEIQLNKDQVETNKINLDIAKRRLEETQVFSPIDGVVVSREVQIGQIISSGISNVGGGTTIMTVSDLSKIYIYASVDESDIGKEVKGQSANITVDAFPDTQFLGKVETISPMGVNESNVVTFEVEIEVISENKPLLKPEMTANVDIIAAEKTDVLTLPSDTVILKNQKYWVTVVNDQGVSEEREVQTGINDFTKVEIVQGLAGNEKVVLHETAPVSQWNEGSGPPPPPGP